VSLQEAATTLPLPEPLLEALAVIDRKKNTWDRVLLFLPYPKSRTEGGRRTGAGR
jgi:hypothetical protein